MASSKSDASVKNVTTTSSISDSYNTSSNVVTNTSNSYNRTDSGGNVYVGDVASKAVESQLASVGQAGLNIGEFKLPLLVGGIMIVGFFVFIKLKG